MSEILKATHEGILNLGDIELECHVLENGERIFSSRDLLNALDLNSTQKNQSRVLAAFFIRIKLISLSDIDLSNHLSEPIRFTRKGKGGKPAIGYMAELLPEICNAILKLQNRKYLPKEYQKAAERSRIFLRIFAKVGIIALIDEATGYQAIRPRDALQTILDRYLLKEYAAWAKRFPDKFYKEMFRLKRWEWENMKINKPSIVGKYTNDIVYNRLAPGVLKELQKLNPPVNNGKRKFKHHQWLTEDIGHPALSHHLYALVALMKASQEWGQFYRTLKKAFPVLGDQIELIVNEE